jgi:hypothetical protein
MRRGLEGHSGDVCQRQHGCPEWVCEDIRYNRAGSPDIPECCITKSGQEPLSVTVSELCVIRFWGFLPNPSHAAHGMRGVLPSSRSCRVTWAIASVARLSSASPRHDHREARHASRGASAWNRGHSPGLGSSVSTACAGMARLAWRDPWGVARRSGPRPRAIVALATPAGRHGMAGVCRTTGGATVVVARRGHTAVVRWTAGCHRESTPARDNGVPLIRGKAGGGAYAPHACTQARHPGTVAAQRGMVRAGRPWPWSGTTVRSPHPPGARFSRVLSATRAPG